MSLHTTIVDVLENAFDGDLSNARIDALSLDEIDELFDAVNLFYEGWTPPAPSAELLRVHLGGWIAGTANVGIARDLLNSALLYAHEVVVYDPVAAYFEPGRPRLRTLPVVRGAGIDLDAAWPNQEAKAGYVNHRENLEAHRAQLKEAIGRVAALAPLIQGGVALPVPHLRVTLTRQEKIYSAIRHLLADDDYLDVLEHPVDRPPLARDSEGPNILFQVPVRSERERRLQFAGDPAYYLARTLAVADAAGASYLPPSATEWAIYEERLRRLGETIARRTREHLYVAPAVVASDLPFLKGLPMETLLAARSSADAFEHWRAALRKATRTVRSLPSEGDLFVEEAKDVLRDELSEVAAEVQQLTRRSAVLARNLRANSLTVATGVGGLSAAAAVAGTPVAGGVGVLGSGILKWLADSLLPAPLHGTKAVLANFVHHVPAAGDEDNWPQREGIVISPKGR